MMIKYILFYLSFINSNLLSYHLRGIKFYMQEVLKVIQFDYRVGCLLQMLV